MIVTDLNEVEYINTIVYEYNNVFNIDISSLPVGAYIISIKDGDDEYVGEFEVYWCNKYHGNSLILALRG